MEIWVGHRIRYNAHNGQHRYRHHHSRSQSFSSALLDAICKSTEDVEETVAYKKSGNRQETRNVEAEDKTLMRNLNYKSFSRVERQWDEDHPAWTNKEKLMRGRSTKVSFFNAEKYEAEAAYTKSRSELHPSFQSSMSSAVSCSSVYTSDSTSNCPYLSSDAESFYKHTSSIPTAKTEKHSDHVGCKDRACKWAVGGEGSRDLHEKSSVRDGAFRAIDKHFIPADHHAKIKSKSKSCKDSKKPKHPISPGSKLAGFLNSLFMGGSTKKPKLSSSYSVTDSNSHHSSERKPTTDSSSSSVQSRPCLSKTSRGSKNVDGVRRCVTFYPTSVIVDEDSRPCGEKCLHGMENPAPHPNPSNYQQIRHPSTDAHKLPLLSKKLKHRNLEKDSHAVAAAAKSIITEDQKTNSIIEPAVVRDLDRKGEDGEEDDDGSCSSSDLFELESLEAIDMNVYEKKLPV